VCRCVGVCRCECVCVCGGGGVVCVCVCGVCVCGGGGGGEGGGGGVQPVSDWCGFVDASTHAHGRPDGWELGQVIER
jgi:hypothetical protein